MLNRKGQDGEGSSINSDINLVFKGYESLEVLTISSERSESEWVLYLGCFFHISPLIG